MSELLYDSPSALVMELASWPCRGHFEFHWETTPKCELCGRHERDHYHPGAVFAVRSHHPNPSVHELVDDGTGDAEPDLR